MIGARTLSQNTQYHYFYNLKPAVELQVNTPTFFRHWYNTTFTTKHTPHHYGWDVAATSSNNLSLHASFNYGDLRKDLEDEWISIFTYSFKSNAKSWKYITRQLTDNDGSVKLTVPSNFFSKGIHIVRFMVEGDLSYCDMYLNIADNKNKFVVFDLDGTLTLSDEELHKDIFLGLINIPYEPKIHSYAHDVVEFYNKREYSIIYLTARPSWLTKESSSWLKANNFPFGILHTNDTFSTNVKADIYKALYLKSLQSVGINIKYLYGNAYTDILAYKTLKPNPKEIFIIGEHAGKLGSTPISSYEDHLSKLNSRNKHF